MADDSPNVQQVDAVYQTGDGISVVFAALYDASSIRSGERPWLVAARLHCLTQDAHGFPSPEEQPILIQVMEPVIALYTNLDAKFIGRVSSKGIRTFYWYAKERPELDAELQKILEAFPAYKADMESLYDPDWRFYHETMVPLPEYNLQKAETKLVLQTLQARGDDLTVARDFDHDLVFPIHQSRQEFIEWASAHHFDIRSAPKNVTTDEQQHEFDVFITRREIPDWKFLNGTIYELVIAAAKFGGRYTGNGCLVQDTGELNKIRASSTA